MLQEYTIQKDTTSNVITVRVIDSSTLGATDNTAGRGLTGLVFNSASLTCYYMRQDDGDADSTAVSLVTATRGAFTTSGFIQKDATNQPGEYEFGVPNAAVAAGSAWCRFIFKGASNVVESTVHVHLVDETAKTVKDVADLTVNLTEAYRADGSEGSVAEILYEVLALLAEVNRSGTTITTKKIDGAATAGTYTLNDASAPTSITRAT